MKTGDASAEIWVHGLRHAYCCEMTSQRKTPESRVRYFWRVEMVEAFGAGASVVKTKFKPCRTVADAVRLARRMADYLERKRMQIDERSASRA